MSRELFHQLATRPLGELPLAIDGVEKKRWTKRELDDAMGKLGWVYVEIDPGLRWLILTAQIQKRPQLEHKAVLTKIFPRVLHPVLQLMDALMLELKRPRSDTEVKVLRPELGLPETKEEGKEGLSLAEETARYLATVVGASLRQGMGQRDPWLPLLRTIGQFPRYADLLESEILVRERLEFGYVLFELECFPDPVVRLLVGFFS